MAEHHIVMIYTDRPGIVAVYGKEFGEASINIAGMQIARQRAGLKVCENAAEITKGQRLPAGATPVTLTGSHSAKAQPSPGAVTSTHVTASCAAR